MKATPYRAKEIYPSAHVAAVTKVDVPVSTVAPKD